MSAGPAPELRWIFFDLDGTLADSVPILFNAYRAFVSRLGVTDQESDLSHLNGFSLREIVEHIRIRYNVKLPTDLLVEQYKIQLRESYESEVKPFDGADATLRSIREKYHLQLVTSGASSEAMAFVRKQGWDSLFSSYVFGDEVTKGKPDPEMYLLALTKAQCGPLEAMVVEDSVNGIKAARAANLRVIGVGATSVHKHLIAAGANRTTATLPDLLHLL